MSDGNRNAGREALPAGPERPSITLPAELAVHLGRELSASAVDDNGWTDLHYAAALDWPSWPGCCSGPERRLNARLRTDGVLLGPGLLSTLGRCGQDRFSRRLRTGATPLHIAAPRATHRLHWAASGDAVAAVEVLLSPGASIQARADDGSKPLDAAAARHAWRAGRAVAVERRQYGDDARRRRRLLPGYRFGDGALTRARPTTSGLSRTGTGIRDGE